MLFDDSRRSRQHSVYHAQWEEGVAGRIGRHAPGHIDETRHVPKSLFKLGVD